MPILARLASIADYRPDPHDLNQSFRPLNVETLLNQSADLLDRCLHGLRELNDLAAQAATWDRLGIDVAALELAAKIDENRARKDGPLESESFRAFQRDRFFSIQATKDAWVNLVQDATRLRDADVEGVEKLRNAVDFHETRLAELEHGLNQELAEKTKNWAALELSYERERVEGRSKTAKDLRNHIESSKAIGLDEQQELAVLRVDRDYRDALRRALSAEIGLKSVFDYPSGNQPYNPTDPGPPEKWERLAQPPASLSPIAAVTHLTQWVRRAIEWHVAYTQFEEVFTVVASLRALVGEEGENGWDALREADATAITRKFTLPSFFGRNYFNVRIRGLSASLVGFEAAYPWRVSIELPTKVRYNRPPLNPNEDGPSHYVDQAVPICVLGRVQHSAAFREPELCGTGTLANASPFGATDNDTWRVTLERPVVLDAPSFADLKDVVLEFVLVGMPELRGAVA